MPDMPVCDTAVCDMPVSDLAGEFDLHRLELRFAPTRVEDKAAVQRLADSIQECGQRVACIAAGQPQDGRLVLIDGYRRVAALQRLGRDTAQVQCWRGPVSSALAQLLARSRSRPFTALEEALLLRELIDAHGMTQREAARQCARDASWVQRRLMLLGVLPETLVAAVRASRISAWAAARIFAPLARANADHATQLLAGQQAQALSTRELQTWYVHYQGAQRSQRERMVEHPRLFLASLAERERDRAASQLRQGPERDVVSELGHLQALLDRVRRQLQPLNTPAPPSLARACARVQAALPEMARELGRFSHDPDRDPQQRAHLAGTGLGPARDQPAAGVVAQHRAGHPA